MPRQIVVISAMLMALLIAETSRIAATAAEPLQSAALNKQKENPPAAAAAEAVPAVAVAPAAASAPAASPASGDIYARFVGQRFMHGIATSKKIALTFDDGPDPRTTPQVLEILKREGIHATFFMLGQMIEKSPGLAKTVADAGHEIGNHTYNHPKMRTMNSADARVEIERTSALIEQVTGQRTHLFRPPYNLSNSGVHAVCREGGLVMVIWSADPRDWEPRITPERVTATALRQAGGGGIICMHDTRHVTIQALPGIIAALKAKGYEFVTVSEILGEASQAPPSALTAGAGAGAAPEPPAGPLVISLDQTARN